MTKKIIFLFISIHVIFTNPSHAQNQILNTSFKETSILFQNQTPISMQLKFSIKKIKKNTNDSTYIESILFYKNESDLWDSIKTDLRARGNFRRKNCYYVPLKLKLKKTLTEGTIFFFYYKLKIVLPCLIERYNNDYVMKEYMAYKLYEIISPYHFKTRLANIEFLEEKGKRIKKHEIKGIIIEDIDKVAERYGGNEYDKVIHPMELDTIIAIRNSFFQYLIGNTDFSLKFQHNEKLLFINKKFIIIPYDFDMSGLVNTSYATISGTQNLPIKITEVTQRAYKGYPRNELLLQKVREEFMANKDQIFNTVNGLQEFFKDQKQFYEAKKFIAQFYEVIENNKKFKKNFISRARTK